MPRRKDILVPRTEEVIENETVRKIREEVLQLSVEDQGTYKPEGIPMYTLNPADFKHPLIKVFYRRVFKAVKAERHRKSNYVNMKKQLEAEYQEKVETFQRDSQERELEYQKRYEKLAEREKGMESQYKIRSEELENMREEFLNRSEQLHQRELELKRERKAVNEEKIKLAKYLEMCQQFSTPMMMAPEEGLKTQNYEEVGPINGGRKQLTKWECETIKSFIAASSMEGGNDDGISDDFLDEMDFSQQRTESVDFGQANDLSGEAPNANLAGSLNQVGDYQFPDISAINERGLDILKEMIPNFRDHEGVADVNMEPFSDNLPEDSFDLMDE